MKINKFIKLFIIIHYYPFVSLDVPQRPHVRADRAQAAREVEGREPDEQRGHRAERREVRHVRARRRRREDERLCFF